MTHLVSKGRNGWIKIKITNASFIITKRREDENVKFEGG